MLAHGSVIATPQMSFLIRDSLGPPVIALVNGWLNHNVIHDILGTLSNTRRPHSDLTDFCTVTSQ